MNTSVQNFDMVIVGGGSAGSVLANRLSADGQRKVLVLEAGRKDSWWDLLVQMPAALMFPAGNKAYDWAYQSDPEPFMGGRRVKHARGKLLGGSSSINGMIFQRGNPMDYERWGADPGMQSWDFEHCLPYFKRLETATGSPNDPMRGQDGPLVMRRGPASNPLFEAFFSSAAEAGYLRTDDVNGYRQEGFGPFDSNIHRGRRLNAARAYIAPVRRRPNLTVLTRAFVTGVRIDKGRATGVSYTRHGKAYQVNAGEVILCGGAINTPQLLQLAGIGEADHLRSLGISPTVNLPGVGENLQDHLEVYIQHGCPQPVSEQPSLDLWRMPFIGAQWMLSRTGSAASNHFEGGGFARSNDEVSYPNLMFHFLPLAVRYDGKKAETRHGFQLHVGPMYSDSRGKLRIRSADPRQHPSMVFNYLSTEQDRREWVEAIQVSREILSQPAMRPYNSGELSPGPQVRTDKEILDWVARDAETALHPCGTAKMGPDTDRHAVVDPLTMQVHGVQGLRVVDASAMPYVTNGNIYAPVMMLAEKAADLILGVEPPRAEAVDFYRYQPQSETI